MGGLSLFQPDWMHCKSLGTDSNLAGSVIAFMCKVVLKGPPEHNVAFLWEQIQQYYSQHQTTCRLSQLTWNMVQHKPFYKLSAKAVETRDLLPALATILGPWVDNNPIVAWFQRLLVLSTKLDELVFGNPDFWLSASEKKNLKEGIFEYNQVLTKLAWHFHAQGKPFCNYTIKNHYLCHLGLIAADTGISPRLAFCYQGEDFMSLIKNLAGASSRGMASSKLMNKVMAKYIRGLDFLLLSREG